MKSENGRSMVEMLGVLAIIGVLSVGAISGYSKAMFKYKLNKHTEQMNTLINAVARNVHSFDNFKYGQTMITPYLIKMGEIPTEMVKDDDDDVVYDIFGHTWYIYTYDFYIYLVQFSEDSASFFASSSPNALSICQNILTISKGYSDTIHTVSTQMASHTFKYIFGDKVCNAAHDMGYKCFKDLTLNDIYTICAEYDKGDVGMFQLVWERR